MNISLIIPILYAPDNTLYQQAVKSALQSWKKVVNSSRRHSLQIVLVFNQFPPSQPVPKLRLPKKQVKILTHSLNRGFTGAVNDGVWFATFHQRADWCLVLNDDATVDEDFFHQLLPELKPSRAVVSCGIRNPDDSLQSAGLIYGRTGLTRPLEHFSPTPYFVGTAFFVSRRTILHSIREYGWLLADFFFAYAEDLELSLRLRRANKKVFLYPKTLVTHQGSLTARRGSAFQLYWGYRNLLFLIALHWPTSKILLSLPQLLWGQVYMLGLLLVKGHWLTYPKIWWSVWKNRAILRYYRRIFYEKLPHYHSV